MDFSQVVTIALNVEDIPDSLGGFFLSCDGDMDVGVQGEACGEVTQHTAYRLDDHTVLGGNDSKAVAEIVCWGPIAFKHQIGRFADNMG